MERLRDAARRLDEVIDAQRHAADVIGDINWRFDETGVTTTGVSGPGGRCHPWFRRNRWERRLFMHYGCCLSPLALTEDPLSAARFSVLPERSAHAMTSSSVQTLPMIRTARGAGKSSLVDELAHPLTTHPEQLP